MGPIYFLVLLAIIYAVVSIRVLKQYERGVVFVLGRFTSVRDADLRSVPDHDAGVAVHRHHADSVAEDHHQG